MPFTANYELTLAGTRGAAYSNNSGGPGYTLTKTVRLNYGDEVKVELPTAPSYSQSGNVLTIPGGNPAKLWVNGTLYWSAAGGQGKVNTILPASVTSVKVQSGNGTSTGSYSTYPVHHHTGNGGNIQSTVYSLSNPGGCYGCDGHTHNTTGVCIGTHTHDENCIGYCGYKWWIYYDSHDYADGCDWHSRGWQVKRWRCGNCGHIIRYELDGWNEYTDDMPYEHCEGNITHCTQEINTWSCNDEPNTWTLHCGLEEGVAIGYTGSQQPGTCYTVDSPSAALTSTGNAYFTIKLAETETLFYKNVKIPKGDLRYLNSYADLVILDNTVCYFKRR